MTTSSSIFIIFNLRRANIANFIQGKRYQDDFRRAALVAPRCVYKYLITITIQIIEWVSRGKRLICHFKLFVP